MNPERSKVPLLAMLALLYTGLAAAKEEVFIEPYSFCPQWQEKAPKIDAVLGELYPGKDGSLMIRDEFTRLTSVPKEEELALLKQFRDKLKARGTELVMVVPPPRNLLNRTLVADEYRRYFVLTEAEMIAAYRSAIAALRRSGAIVPDLLEAVEKSGIDPTTYYRRQDVHWNGVGAEVTARAVAEVIEKEIDISQLPRKQYVTRTIPGTRVDRATMELERICKTKIPVQITPGYVTTAVEEPSSGADALFADTVQPVALVGTSFSRSDQPAQNFPGFLSQYLSMDVLGVAITGGGLTQSLISYLGSVEFQESPPSILIWEVRYMAPPDVPVLRRALATLQGPCQAPLAQNTQPLRRGATRLLTLSPEQRRSQRPLYVDIDVGDSGLNDFKLLLEYADFSRQSVEIDLTRAPVSTQHYYFEFSPERLRKLESVAIRPAMRMPGQVTASLCTAKT